MGIAIPQVITPSRATGAQVIDGSLKFDSGKSTKLSRIPDSAGNRKTWTWSGWVKRTPGAHDFLFNAKTSSTLKSSLGFWSTNDYIRFKGDYNDGTARNFSVITSALFRDTGWYHIVTSLDTTQSTDTDRIKIYVNGVLQELTSTTYPTQNSDIEFNNTSEHLIGSQIDSAANGLDGALTNVTFVDGQALGPEYFGFTDPLTNTWKPKKYTGDFNIAAESYSTDIGVFTRYNTTPNADSTVAYLNSNPDSSSYPLIQSSQSSNNTITVKFASAQNGVTSIKFRGGGYSSSSTYTLFVNGTQVGGTHNTNTLWAEDSHTISSTNITELKIVGSDGFALGQLKFDDSLVSGTVSYGTEATGVNSFYLPMDGNSPIGQDQSGNGNNWTPVNFGGSVALDNPIVSGALPILNTTQGGTQAGVGVRTDATVAAGVGTCVLALPLVGNPNDVSNLIDSGSTTKAVTANGNAASSTQSNFYAGSFYFDGNGDYLQMDASADTDLSGDFTIEAWAYPTANGESSNSEIVGRGAASTFNGWHFGQRSGNTKVFFGVNYGGTGSANWTETSNGMKLNDWNHIAVTRSGDTVKIFINGSLDVTNTLATGRPTVSGTEYVYIGRGSYSLANREFNGYIQDVRIYNGVAKYTSDFVVPATSPDILPDTPSGVSGGSKLTKITDGAVYFDGTGDYLSMSQSTDFAVGTGDFTFECFVYSESTPASWQQFFSTRGVQGSATGLWFGLDNSTRTPIIFSGSSAILSSSRDILLKTWNHIAYVRNNGTLKLYLNGKETASVANTTDFTDDYGSIGAETTDANGAFPFNGYISNLRLVKGTAVYTSEFAPPTEPLTEVTNTKLLCCQSNTSATASVVVPISSGTGYTGNTSAITVTSASLNAGSDTNTVDGNTSTSADIRGAGSFVQLVFPQQQNGTLQVNVANGNDVNDDDIRVFIDGVEGTSFDVSSQQWYTIHTGDFTTVKLEHQGSTTGYIYGFRIGTDGDTIINASGGLTANGDAAATNFNPFNTDINTVRGQETGYATLNPLSTDIVNSATLTNGNLKLSALTFGHYIDSRSTIAASSINCYCEMKVEDRTGAGLAGFGVGDQRSRISTGVGSYLNYRESGAIIKYPGNTTVETVSGYTTGDVIGMTATSTEVAFYKNGALQGTYNHGLTGDFFVTAMAYHNGNNCILDFNFGQKPFKFPPPDGFQPLNTANTRPVNLISRPDQYVGVTTGNFDQQKTHVTGFQPDLIWHKARTAGSHFLTDSVRGVNSYLSSNNTNAAGTFPVGGQYGITSFNSNGWTQGGYGPMSESSMVAWTWKAGGDKNTFNIDDVGYATAAAAGLDAGVVTPSGASVGTKQGFAILKYNGTGGQTCSHGLTQAPEFIIEKEVGQTSAWTVQTTVIDGSLDYLYLDKTDQANDYNVDAPTSTVFDIGRNNECIAYLWHSVPGFSKFGSFTTVNSSSEYVHLGFKPAIVWIKRTGKGSTTNLTTYGSWYVNNSEMSSINPASYEEVLWLNENYAKGKRGNGGGAGTYLNVDFLSDGFRMRGSANAEIGQPNDINIYCAWAEAPSIDLYGGGANAR